MLYCIKKCKVYFTSNSNALPSLLTKWSLRLNPTQNLGWETNIPTTTRPIVSTMFLDGAEIVLSWGWEKTNPNLISGGHRPPHIPKSLRSNASFRSASGLPEQVIGCRDSVFPSRPEADLKEALGDLLGDLGGGRQSLRNHRKGQRNRHCKPPMNFRVAWSSPGSYSNS